MIKRHHIWALLVTRDAMSMWDICCELGVSGTAHGRAEVADLAETMLAEGELFVSRRALRAWDMWRLTRR